MSDENNQGGNNNEPKDLNSLLKQIATKAEKSRLNALKVVLTALTDKKTEAERTVRQIQEQIDQEIEKYNKGL